MNVDNIPEGFEVVEEEKVNLVPEGFEIVEEEEDEKKETSRSTSRCQCGGGRWGFHAGRLWIGITYCRK
jgi:hypothetical protein